MKLVFLTLKSSREAWAEEALEIYKKKISRFHPYSHIELKSRQFSRLQSDSKKKAEEELILEFLEPTDYVVLLDEKGRRFKDSVAFSKDLSRALESGRQRIIFLVGGPYGVGEKVKSRSDACWSLSSLTMNHFVAQVMVLEQIYRGLTLRNNIPYHNI